MSIDKELQLLYYMYNNTYIIIFNHEIRPIPRIHVHTTLDDGVNVDMKLLGVKVTAHGDVTLVAKRNLMRIVLDKMTTILNSAVAEYWYEYQELHMNIYNHLANIPIVNCTKMNDPSTNIYTTIIAANGVQYKSNPTSSILSSLLKTINGGIEVLKGIQTLQLQY